MSGDVEGEAAQVLTRLDAVGNTTKAITKGIAIATAVLAATALFGAFRTQVTAELGLKHLGGFSLGIDPPNVLVGLIIGASVVFFFAGLLIMAVGRAAGRVVVRGAGAVPQPPGDHGLHREARVRPGGGHLHQGLAARAGHAGPAGGADADRGRVRLRLRAARLVPGRRDRGRRPDGGVPGQLRRRLGQRQEAGRGRPLRRQGLRGARGHGHRRHGRRPVQGHRGPGDQPADQGHEPGLAADRHQRGQVQPQPRACGPAWRSWRWHRGGRDRDLQAPVDQHLRAVAPRRRRPRPTRCTA